MEIEKVVRKLGAALWDKGPEQQPWVHRVEEPTAFPFWLLSKIELWQRDL